MSRFLAILCSATLLGAPFDTGTACTAFCLDSGEAVFVAKNYDWSVDAGMLVLNKRGVIKTADIAGSEDQGTWTSRFGSVTFNQYGRDIPQGGINEAGVVIEILWLNDTEYPAPDDRMALGSTQWIQYQLDTAGSVGDVLRSDEVVRIESNVEVHFFVGDRSGESATVEFLGGGRRVHTGDEMVTPVLTNHPYAESVASLDQFRPSGGSRRAPWTNGSLHRFARASARVAEFSRTDREAPIDYAFETLSEVAQGERTQWSIVYDLTNLEVHFRTRLSPSVKTVSLSALDFDCESVVEVMSIHTSEADPEWETYTRQMNRVLIEDSFRGTSFLAQTPDDVLDAVASYPDQARCESR